MGGGLPILPGLPKFGFVFQKCLVCVKGSGVRVQGSTFNVQRADVTPGWHGSKVAYLAWVS